MDIDSIWIIDSDLTRANKIKNEIINVCPNTVVKDQVFDMSGIDTCMEMKSYSEIKPYTYKLSIRDVLFIHYNHNSQLYLSDFLADLSEDIIVVHFTGNGISNEQKDIFGDEYLENPRSVYIRRNINALCDLCHIRRYVQLVLNAQDEIDLISAKDLLLGMNRSYLAWSEIYNFFTNPDIIRSNINSSRINRILKDSGIDPATPFFLNKSLIQILNELVVFNDKFEKGFAEVSSQLKQLIELKYLKSFE